VAKTQDGYDVSSVLDFHKSEDATDLISSHNAVVSYYAPQMEERELCHDFADGNPWSDEDREKA
jgi:hypothetical protein